jgi:hypothetical protein
MFSSYSVAMTTVISVVAPVSILPECGCSVQDEWPVDCDGLRRACEVETWRLSFNHIGVVYDLTFITEGDSYLLAIH